MAMFTDYDLCLMDRPIRFSGKRTRTVSWTRRYTLQALTFFVIACLYNIISHIPVYLNAMYKYANSKSFVYTCIVFACNHLITPHVHFIAHSILHVNCYTLPVLIKKKAFDRVNWSYMFDTLNDNDEFRFNDASTHEGHLRQKGVLSWFCNETAIMIGHIRIKM